MIIKVVERRYVPHNPSTFLYLKKEKQQKGHYEPDAWSGGNAYVRVAKLLSPYTPVCRPSPLCVSLLFLEKEQKPT